MNLKEASLYRILDDLYNVRLRIAEQTIEASIANRFEQKHLKLKEQTSILHFEGISFDQHHQPVEFFKSSSRGDRFKVSVISQRQTAKTTQTHFSLVLN
jgi:GntR family transcriptional regulator